MQQVFYQTQNDTHHHVHDEQQTHHHYHEAGMTNALQELIAFLRANQPSRPNEGVIPTVPAPAPEAMDVDEAGNRRVRPRSSERPDDVGRGPDRRSPGAASLMVPELIRTNRQIIEQMHNLNRAHEESRAAALRAEELHRAGLDAAAAQNREAHERTMNLFREALHPHAQAIAAMHAGAASLHTAAQDIRDAATMQRAMAGSSSDIFVAVSYTHLTLPTNREV